MNGLPYYKAYPRDFLEGTIGMSFEIKCAYRVVIDLIYMQGGQLPDDARYISGHLGCSLRKWSTIRAALIEAQKIQISNGFLSNYRADKELEITSKYQENQAENARRPIKNKDLQKPPQSQRVIYKEPEPELDIKRDTNVSLALIAPECAQEPDRFQEFWEQYPHRNGAKKGKASAQKAWAKSIRARASPAQIIAGALRYAGDRQVMAGYAKDPASWLNQKGWEDEVEPEPTNSGAAKMRPAPRKITLDEMAEKIKTGKAWLCQNIPSTAARELVAAGLVTPDQCRRVSVPL